MKTIQKFGLYELKWRLYKQPLHLIQHKHDADKGLREGAVEEIQWNW